MHMRLQEVSKRSYGMRAMLGLVGLLGSAPTFAAIELTMSFNGPASYTPGQATASNYVLNIGNTGTTTESGAAVTTNFPAGTTVTWSCLAAGAGTSCRTPTTGTGNLSARDPGDIATGGTLTYTFTVSFASSLTAAPLDVNATITASGGTPPSISRTVSSTRVPVSDFSVAFTGGPTSYTPGTGGVGNNLLLTVSNAGPTDNSGANVTLNLPTGVASANWACSVPARCSPASGSGNIATSVNLVDGGSVGIQLTSVTYASSASANPLIWSASVNETDDGNASNNTATRSLTRTASVDLSVTFVSSPPSTYTPGTNGNSFTLRVHNAGPSDNSPAPLSLVFPTEVAAATWSCTPAAACSTSSGSGNVATNVTLANDTSVDVNLSLNYRSNALLSPLNLTASITATGGDNDTVTGNNSVTRPLTIARVADVRVVKTAPAQVNPGAGFLYAITVTNLGPSDVGNGSGETGIRLDDTFVAQLQGDPDPTRCGASAAVPCWRFCPSDEGTVGAYLPNAACPSELVSGSGAIVNQAFQLRAGSSSQLQAYVAISGSATGTIANTASIDIAEGAVTDPVPVTNNSSTVNTTIVINTDVEVLKSDGVTTAIPGQDHSYTITVRNNGFITANNVAVADTLPLFAGPVTAGFAPGSISWQCSAFDGACCNSNSANCGVGTPTAPVSANALTTAVDLPGQSRVVFTVTGRLHPRATGTLDNTASATMPVGISDPLPSNNSSRDNNTALVPQGSPTISKTLTSLQSLGVGGEGPPYRLNYRMTVGNGGPSFMNDAQVRDQLGSALLLPATASWTCTVVTNPAGTTGCAQPSGSGALLTTVDLDPGAVVRFDLQVDTTAIASGLVVNTAEVLSSAGNASATLTSGLSGQADLALTKTDQRLSAVPGEATEYLITVTNAGPDDVFGARVQDQFAPELENVSWTCAATTPIPGDLSEHSTVGAANTGGNALATSNDGRHVYVIGTASNAVFAFERDNVPGLNFGAVAAIETESDGANDPLDSGGAVSGMMGPIDVVLSPDNATLYVLAPASIVAFNRVTNPADPNFGKLSFAGSVNTGLPTTARRILATAQNLYVSGDDKVSIYRRDQLTGLPVFDMQHLTGMPAAPDAMAVSTSDALLFVGSLVGQDVAMFSINTTAGATPIGRLTFVDSESNADFNGTTDLAIAADQRHLYVAAGGAARISRIDYTPTTMAKSAAYSLADITVPPAQPNPFSGRTRLALSVDGEHLLSVNLGVDPAGSLMQFRRDVISGGLSFEALLIRAVPGGAHLGLSQAAEVAFSPDGRHVFVASASNATRPLTVYARRAPEPRFAFIERDEQGDPLEGGGTLTGLTAVADVVVSPDGRHVYAVGLQDNALIVFRRFSTAGLSDETAGGHLVFVAKYSEGVSGVSGLLRPSDVQISPDGGSVYVTSEEEDSLAVFDRTDSAGNEAIDGRLAFRQVLRDGVSGVDGLLGARAIALDRNAQHVYVAGSFEAAIALFRRNPDRSLSFVSVVRNGSNGVTGLNGIRDITVTRDGAQLLGVSATSNTVVVFDRERNSASPNFGRLTFLQSRALGSGDRPVALAVPDNADPAENEHVYVAAENSSRVYVLRRVLDPNSSAVGTVQPLFVYTNNSGGITRMNGARDVQISADGERVYVAAQFGHSVLVFDRDTTRSSAGFGGLALVETRTDSVDGVDGIDSVYALAVSPDSRHVYAAGFGDNAVASFVVGTGSSCSASGSGNIDDEIDIGVGGTLVYRINARIRPDAVGTLSNTAEVLLPDRFDDGSLANNEQTDTTQLTPRADLSVTKTNDRVSVVAGEDVTYEIVVRNAGSSNIVHSASNPFTLSDLLSAQPGFDAGTAQWSCLAAGSGALEYVDGYFQGQGGISGMNGVSGLALANVDATHRYLASVSVVDGTLNIFERDLVDGRLLPEMSIAQGSTLNAVPVDALAGARSVAASRDGQFLYVASRISDAVSVFKLSIVSNQLRVDLVQVQRNVVGLDQALHLVLSPDTNNAQLYVAGANDDAIAVFARDAVTGMLSLLESEQNGINDPSDAGGSVAGLDGVEYLTISPDGAHLYALSGSGGSVSVFTRSSIDGRLSWRNMRSGNDLGESMAGASSATFDASGTHLYVTAADANRVLVLERETGAALSTFGDLSLASSVTQGVNGTLGLLAPTRAVLSADGVHLYVTASSGGSVSWFIRDPIDGGLTFLGLRSNESAGVAGLSGATDLILDNGLNQIYVAGTQQSAIAQFERLIDSFCPTSGSGDLNAIPLRIAAGGSVTFTLTVRVTTGFSGSLQNTVTLNAAQDTTPGNNQATDTDSTSVVADLAITKSDGLAEFDGLAGATAIVGDDQQLYVAGADDNAIGVYDRITTPAPNNGNLKFNSFLRSGEAGVVGLAAVNDLLLSGDGDHVYATSPTDSSVATFRRNRMTGGLSFVEIEQNGVFGVTGMSGAQAVAQSPDGAHLYVAGGFSNAIAVFARDNASASPDYGRLTFKNSVQNGVGGVDGIANPVALLVAPDGRHVYVLGEANDSVAVFSRNPNSGSSGFGQLSFVARYLNGQGGFTGLAGVRSLLINNAGTNLYVLGSETGTLVRLARDATSGALSPGQVLTNGVAGATSGAQTIELNELNGVPGSSGLAGALRIRWSPARDQIYVAGTDADALSVFSVNASDGNLSFASRIDNGDPAPLTGGQVLGLDGVRDLIVVPDAAHVYAVAAIDNAATSFQRATVDGALSFRAALFDGLGGVAPGESVTYLITATNNGPSNVTGARVVDEFPDAFDQIAWTCTTSGGASCLSNGVGSIDTPVDLPIGGRVVFQATGVVGDGASGRLINTATISSSGNLDPLVGNNSATDADTVLSPAMDLVVSVDDGATVSIPGNRVDYEVTVGNLGPTYASGVTVSDLIPPALYNVAWSCNALPVAGTLSLTQSIVAAGDGHNAIAVGALGNFVYSVGQRSGQSALIAYQRNPLNGTLSEVAAYRNGVGGVAGIVGAADVLLSSDERYVYVAGANSDAIALFARDTTTGLLSFVRQYQDGVSGIDGLGGVRSLLFGPGGLHLYAAGQIDDAIAVFSVNPASGALTQASIIRQTTPGVDGLNGVSDLALSSDGAQLFAVATVNQSLSAFNRNSTTGALTFSVSVQDFQFPTTPGVLLGAAALTVHQNEVYVAASDGDRVARFLFTAGASAQFALDKVISNGQGGVSGMQQPRALVYDADQARLYVASGNSGALHLFSLLGAQPQLLEQRAAAAFPVLSGATALALSHNGKQLYTATGSASGGIGVWARERGSRCPIIGTRQIGNQIVDIAPGGSVTFDIGGDIFTNALGNLVYRVQADTRVASEELNPADNSDTDTNLLQPAPDLSIAKSDGLTQVTAGMPIQYQIDMANAGISDALLARVTDNAPIFPAQTAGLLANSGTWTCTANLPLAFTRSLTDSTQAALTGVTAMALARDGTQMFAANPASNALLVFARQVDGTLAAPSVITNGTVLGDTTADGLAGASNVAVTGDDRHVLVVSSTANSLLVFSREAMGALRFRQKLTSGTGGVSGLLGPADVVVSRDGSRVFVASTQSNAIAVFSRDAASGVLSFVERVADGLGTIVPDSNVIRGVRRLHLSDDGGHLYAVATLSNALSRFSVNASTGKLSYLGVHRSTAPGLAALAGARDLVAAPGDTQIYALGSSGISRFDRALNGALTPAGGLSPIPELTAGDARALAMDAFGSRLYLSDAAGGVHVFARDWSNGALDHRLRFTATPGALGAANELLYVASSNDLYLSSATPGLIAQLDELPLSRCLTRNATADAIATDIDLGVDGTAALRFNAVVDQRARGTLSNTATIQPGTGVDPVSANNTATDQTAIIVVSDVSISKTAPTQAVAGTPISYQIQVRNTGPSASLGLQIIDNFAAALRNVSWMCSSSGTSICPANGTGNIAVTTDLLSGDVLTFTVNATVASSFVGTLSNQASLIPEAGATDPTPTDQVATVQTNVIAVADVAVTKSNGVTQAVAGTTISYQINVSNAGPSDAPAVRVIDTIPAALATPTWTCAGSAGGSCPANGSGDIDFNAALPAGASVQLIVNGLLPASASGTLTNTVSAQALGVVQDPVTTNNQATDSDAIIIVPDVSLSLTDPLDPFDPAGTIRLPFIASVSNAGPSDAHNVVVDLTPSLTVGLPLPAGCVPVNGVSITCSLGLVPAGTTRNIEFAFNGLPPTASSFTLQGMVTTVDADPNLANNTDSETTQFVAGGNIRVSITNGVTTIPTGYVTIYRILVENIGSRPANDVVIASAIAPELIDTSWSCIPSAGASCTVPPVGGLNDDLSLLSGQSVVYTLVGTVDPMLDVSTPRTVTQSVTATAPPGADINLIDNAASDVDAVTPVLYADGFENPPPPIAPLSVAHAKQSACVAGSTEVCTEFQRESK